MSEAPARGRGPQGSGSEAEPAESSPIRRMALYAPPRSTRHSAAKRRRARLWVLAAAALAVLAAAGAGEEQAEGAEQASPLGWYTGPSDWDVADFAESITAFTLTLSGVIAGSRQFGALD